MISRRIPPTPAIPLSHELRLFLFLILGCAALGVARPRFLQSSNLIDVLIAASPAMIAAAGMTIIIVSGGIDISIGSLFGACAIAAGSAARDGFSIPVAAAIALGIGAMVGVFNGLLIAVARIPAIVVTLGMLSIMRGTTIYLTGGNEVRELPASFRNLSLGAWLGAPNPILFAGIAIVLTLLFMSATKTGREMYAIGGNAAAAQLSAIPVRRLQLLAYMLGGLFVGAAALVRAAQFSSIQVTTGTGFELMVITSVVLGGTSILGGRGNVLGSALGAILLETIPNALTFLNVREYWKPAAQGAVVLLAVLSSASARR